MKVALSWVISRFWYVSVTAWSAGAGLANALNPPGGA
jgi:hypothetical protein